MKKFNIMVLALAIASLTPTTKGADIFNGLKGPTPYQFDIRGSYTQEGKPTHTGIIKYWNKQVWGFASTDNNKTTIGAGPNVNFSGEFGTLGFLPYTSISKTEQEYSGNIGTFGTYLSKDKKQEIDFSVNYNLKKINYGAIAGGALSKYVRVAGGINWSDEIQPQVNLRILDPESKNHLEFRILSTKQGPKMDVYLRINIGKK